ncbi:hypothetical protein D3C81_1814740 [compost metagenome]
MFGDIQPAADDALGDALGILEWLHPVVDPHFPTLQLNGMHRLDRLTIAHGLQVIAMKVRQALEVCIG